MWIIYAICAAITWGLSYSLDERILQNKISPITLLFFQTFLAFFVYLGILFFKNTTSEFLLINSKKENYWLLSAAAICAMVGNIFICFSIKEKNATLAAILELTYPLFTIVFTYLLFKQVHLSAGVVFGGILILAGAAVISLTN